MVFPNGDCPYHYTFALLTVIKSHTATNAMWISSKVWSTGNRFFSGINTLDVNKMGIQKNKNMEIH